MMLQDLVLHSTILVLLTLWEIRGLHSRVSSVIQTRSPKLSKPLTRFTSLIVLPTYVLIAVCGFKLHTAQEAPISFTVGLIFLDRHGGTQTHEGDRLKARD